MSSTSNAFAYIVQPSDASPNSSEGEKLWSTALTAASKKVLDSRILYKDSGVTSLVSVGKEFAAKEGNARRELVRKAAGKAVGQVKDAVGSGLEVKDVVVDDGGLDAHAAGMYDDRHTARHRLTLPVAVGSRLGLHSFTLKTKPDANPSKDVSVGPSTSTDKDAWARGIKFAEAQILAREVSDNSFTSSILTMIRSYLS